MQAPVERVWEVMCDSGRYPDWGAQTLETERADGPVEMGSTYDERVPFIGPWKAVVHWRVSEFEPPRRQVHTGQVWYTDKLISEMECSPADDGTTFTMTLRSTPRLGLLGGLFERALAASVQRNWDQTVENFKQLAETPEAGDDDEA